MHDTLTLASFVKDDLSPLISLALFAWGIFQWRVARREAAKTRQAEEATKYAVQAQTQAEADRDEKIGREKELWSENRELRGDLKDQIKLLKQDVCELRAAQKETASERDALKIAVDALADRITEQDAKLAERDALKSENSRLKREVADLKNQVADLRAEVQSLRQEVKEHP